MTKRPVRPVSGIDKVKKMESSGDFDVEKVVETVDGITDIYAKFNAYSVDLIADNGVRILKFWWDGSARNI